MILVFLISDFSYFEMQHPTLTKHLEHMNLTITLFFFFTTIMQAYKQSVATSNSKVQALKTVKQNNAVRNKRHHQTRT